jgi:Glyoxalase superfamily protein/ClpX C4-type zinc finger
MRTHKDAKTMAKSLRGSLAARNVLLSHSDCLEIVAKEFGFADWNTLAAKLDVAPPHVVRSKRFESALQSAIPEGTCKMSQTAAPEQLSCSFCGKSKVRSLVEGGCSRDRGAPHSCVFICDECVAFCAQVNADLIGPNPQDLAVPD